MATPTPLSIAPANGATINTNLPLLEMTFDAHTRKQKAEWQLATDATFDTNVRTITQSNARYTNDSYASQTVPSGSALFQGTWYLRGRSIDADGVPSEWTASNSFTVTHPPSMTSMSPSSDESVPYGSGDIAHSWTFFDTSPDDEPTAFHLQIERNSDGTLVEDTGKVASTLSEYISSISATYNNTRLRWRGKLWDKDDVGGNWSSWETYWLADLPVVTVTSPVDGSTVDRPDPSVGWSLDLAVDRSQEEYRVVFARTSDGVAVHDTGFVSSTDQSYSPPSILANNSDYSVTVYVRDDLGNEGSDTNTISTSWVAPADPVLTVDAFIFTRYGHVRLTWTNGEEDAGFVRYDLYRRREGESDYELIYSTESVAASYEYYDTLAAANVNNEYRLVQIATRFGANVESESPARVVYPTSDSYWLVVPDDADLTVELFHTTGDSFQEVYEEATINLIGRGRHKEVGDRLGFAGTLAAQLRDRWDATAREQRQRILRLKETDSNVYLRNPFGDVWLVSPGGIDITRVPGVGVHEFADVSIAYEEVAE